LIACAISLTAGFAGGLFGRSQGTVEFDAPATLEAYKEMAAGVPPPNLTVVAPHAAPASPSLGSSPAILGRQYFATRTADDLYDLVNGPLVATQNCQVYARASLAMLTKDNIVFLGSNQSCTVARVHTR
jgi:hypothetical protein